jgi:hypothetical protein
MRIKPAGKSVRKPTLVPLTEECPTEAQIAALGELLRPQLTPESLLAVSVATMSGSITVALRFGTKQVSVSYTTDEVQRLGERWPEDVEAALTKPA